MIKIPHLEYVAPYPKRTRQDYFSTGSKFCNSLTIVHVCLVRGAGTRKKHIIHRTAPVFPCYSRQFILMFFTFSFVGQEADIQLMQLVAAAEDAGVDMASPTGMGGRMGGGRSAHQDSIEYEEFRQPDVNGDNMISKQEVG